MCSPDHPTFRGGVMARREGPGILIPHRRWLAEPQMTTSDPRIETASPRIFGSNPATAPDWARKDFRNVSSVQSNCLKTDLTMFGWTRGENADGDMENGVSRST